MHRYTPRLALGLVFIASATSAAPLPVQEYAGRGTQVYRCGTTDGAPSWQLLGPDAHMYDARRQGRRAAFLRSGLAG